MNTPNCHQVLDEGLPDWRMPAFYDRQVQVVTCILLFSYLINNDLLGVTRQHTLHLVDLETSFRDVHYIYKYNNIDLIITEYDTCVLSSS